MTNSAILSNLVADTRDGDWGKNIKADGYTPCRVIRGADFPSVRLGTLSDVPVRYLSKTSLDRRTLRPNDIIIETAGGAPGRPTGRTLLVTERLYKTSDLPLACASFCRFLRIDPATADPAFVFWYLQSLYARGEMWEHQVQHTGLARFQYTRFANTIEILLPPAPAQHAIANLLCLLDEKIASSQLMNNTLEEIATAIFKHWFIDFEFPNEKGNPYKSSGGVMVRNEELQKEIPRLWEVATFGKITKLTMGLSPKGESYNTEGRGVALINGAADFSDGNIVPKKFTTQPTRICNAGDLLFCIRGTIGNLTYADKPYCLGRGVAAITPSSNIFEEFDYLILKQKISHMSSQATGSVIVGLSKPDITNLKILLPPETIVSKFHAIMENIFTKRELSKVEADNLTRIRNSLLPKLMLGKIRVPVEVR
jgi:type I restriction enzyme S subunit